MITTATEQEILLAIKKVNERFGENIKLKNIKRLSSKRIRFTLTVINSSGAGAVIRRNRRVSAACWHVHGYFFEELFKINSDAYVKTTRYTKRHITVYYGNWQDCGSRYGPLSEACGCR